jgi:acyl-CoA synthetase (AMP-forming)/AMP-acid ligase II
LPEHARYRPDLPALKVSASECTFAQLNAQVNRLANAMLATGIAKGDKVSTLMTNRQELVLMYWAAAKTGIVFGFVGVPHERRGGNPEAGNPRQLPGVLTACCIAPALIGL